MDWAKREGRCIDVFSLSSRLARTVFWETWSVLGVSVTGSLESAARISVHSQKFVDPPISLECHGSATAQKANGFSVQPGCLEISRSENCFNNFRVSGPASTLPFSYAFHYKSRLVIDEPLLCEYTPTLQSEV